MVKLRVFRYRHAQASRLTWCGEKSFSKCEGRKVVQVVPAGWASLRSVHFADLGLKRFMLSINAWAQREISLTIDIAISGA